MKDRYLSVAVCRDLSEKMVFLGGPRQVGKTTLARDILPPLLSAKPAYYNWDAETRKKDFLESS
jgi:hypothetical protein